MKRIWIMFLLASCGAGADVTVFTAGDNPFPPAVTYVARDETARMFSDIGVHLVWRKGERPNGHAGEVQVLFARAEGAHPGAMAFSQPFDPNPVIVVFCDRIAELTQGRPYLMRPFLAHVLAHEIGHVLMRTEGHAPSGVMKAHWSGTDYSEMLHRPLRFLAADAAMIQSNLAAAKLTTVAASRSAFRGRSGDVEVREGTPVNSDSQ